ncbi:hypothetical protein [Methylobacterium indicum]|uniref:PIN-like domain-containing protein n=1 Tax=Methylobacterium indicum TaxID=1775910 RepID=UPI001042259A|nr:hypothetical protein [Methylobacterium indicum]
MKIAFDEHVPTALVRALQSFADERQFKRLTDGYKITKARDYAPGESDADFEAGSDVPWVKRYAADGGQIVISGDVTMMSRSHERLALLEAGLIVCFFTPQWSNWKFNRKCALLINWWPVIVKTMASADKATFWQIPSNWQEDGKLISLPTDDKKLARIQRQLEKQEKVAAARKTRRDIRVTEGQGKLI